MSEFIDREKAIANIKAAYCCGCENYNGVRCRACQIMDAMCWKMNRQSSRTSSAGARPQKSHRLKKILRTEMFS